MNFELYNELKNQTTHMKEQNFDRSYCSTITRLPSEHRIIIYLLIYHHFVISKKYSDNKKFIIPYGGKTGIKGKGVRFDVNSLPLDLKKIIMQYIKIVSNI